MTKIFHYTTIENLALILKNRNIRFNRLDHVDDREEAKIKSSGKNLSQYFFVSCWTRDAIENIPLWKMYTNNGLGVRICLDEDPFVDYPLPKDPYSIIINREKIKDSKIPTNQIFGRDSSIIPVINEEYGFLKDIEYVDNAIAQTSECLQIKTNEQNIHVLFSYEKIGYFKSKNWAFEKEARFVIPIFPISSDSYHNKKEWNEEMIRMIYYNSPNRKINEYFLSLKDEVLNNIIVRLSPNAKFEHFIIVESLLKQYTTKGILERSQLADKIEMK